MARGKSQVCAGGDVMRISTLNTNTHAHVQICETLDTWESFFFALFNFIYLPPRLKIFSNWGRLLVCCNHFTNSQLFVIFADNSSCYPGVFDELQVKTGVISFCCSDSGPKHDCDPNKTSADDSFMGRRHQKCIFCKTAFVVTLHTMSKWDRDFFS